jgi:hypothetical protein
MTLPPLDRTLRENVDWNWREYHKSRLAEPSIASSPLLRLDPQILSAPQTLRSQRPHPLCEEFHRPTRSGRALGAMTEKLRRDVATNTAKIKTAKFDRPPAELLDEIDFEASRTASMPKKDPRHALVRSTACRSHAAFASSSVSCLLTTSQF